MTNGQILIRTPPGWWDLPLEPSDRSARISRLVDERLADDDTGVDRAGVAAVLEAAAEAAVAAGAVFASQFGVTGGDLAFSASLVVGLERAEPGAADLIGSEPQEGESDVTVERAQLRVGEVLRRASRRNLSGVDLCQVQYFLEVSEHQVLVASGSCVGVGDPASAVELFDAIMATAEITGDPDATTT